MTLETALIDSILAGSCVVALQTVDGTGVLGVIKGNARLLVGDLVDGDLRRWIAGDSHGRGEGKSHHQGHQNDSKFL
jgi:hypothetical protein